MLNIEDKQLVVKVTGEIVESNLAEFEGQAREALDSINTQLVTDDDFFQADKDVKDCQTIETRLYNAVQNIMTQNKGIEEVVRTISKLQDEFREKRLFLSKAITTEKENRRAALINTAMTAASVIVDESNVKKFFLPSLGRLTNSIKGKKSLAKMEEAIGEEVQKFAEEVAEFERWYLPCLESIRESELQYPGLFPDKEQLAAKGPDIVAIEIESRIAKFKLAEKEKAEREEKAAEEVKQEPQQPLVKGPVEPELPPMPEMPPMPKEEPVLQETYTVFFKGTATEINKVLETINTADCVIHFERENQ